LRRNLGLWLSANGLLYLLLGGSYGVALAYLDTQQVGLLYQWQLPFWFIALLGVLAVDLGDYLLHRLSHEWRWLWLLHAVHHSDPNPAASTNLRVHPLHLPMIMGWRLALVAALGIPLEIQVARDSLGFAVGYWHHSRWHGPDWLEKYCSWFLITPSQHRVHHSPVWPETDHNYGAVFNCWDRWFGTWMSPSAVSGRCGLDALRHDTWLSVKGMLLTPWRARRLTRL